MPKPQLQIRRRVTGVGEALLQGPFNLRPPPELDDYGWLERELGLVLRTPVGIAISAAVYVDATPEREECVVPPILRVAQWTRRADIRRATAHDAPAILECLRIAFEPFRSYYSPEGFADTCLTPETIGQRLATMTVFVAESDRSAPPRETNRADRLPHRAVRAP